MVSLPKTGTSLPGTFLPGARSSSGHPAICRRISLVPFLHLQGLSSQTLHYTSLQSTVINSASLRSAAIYNQLQSTPLHYASLRPTSLQSTAINSTSLRSAAIYNQLRPTPLHFAPLQSAINCDQLHFSSLCCNLQSTPTNFATPLRFAATNSAAIYNQPRPAPLRFTTTNFAATTFTSLHKFAATQGPATSRLSGSSL